MRANNHTCASVLPCVGLFLSATLTSAALAGGTAPVWENLMSTTDASVPGVKGAVWVPNQYNNPTIDDTGRVVFRGQIGGAGITTANSKLYMAGVPGSWSILARDGSPVPGGVPAGYVFNTTAGINGLGSSNNITTAGALLVGGSINGPGVVATTDTATYLVRADGTSSLLMRESDAYPGGGGSTMSSATPSSGQKTNSLGESIISTTLLAGDVIGTTNNAAIVVLSPLGNRAICRKGSAAPGFSDGTTITPDTFGLMLGGSDVEFGATLVNAATVTTANDKVRVTSVGAPAGQLRVYCRESEAFPGIAGTFYKSTSTFSNPPRALTNAGKILMQATLSGAVTLAVDDNVLFTETSGAVEVLLRRGQLIPGVADGVYNTNNQTNAFLNNNGMLAFQGLLQNADGTAMATNNTFIAVRKSDGTIINLARQGDAVPGLAGVTYASLNGNSSICLSDSGVVVFDANCLPASNAIMAWDETNGLRVIAKSGDTNFTGTPNNALTLIGSTGSNGSNGGTGLSSNGWLVLRASDSVASIGTIARIYLGESAAPCPADLDGNGDVDASDLATLLGAWGTASADIDGNGDTDASDLATLLGAWGPCA